MSASRILTAASAARAHAVSDDGAGSDVTVAGDGRTTIRDAR